MPSSKAHRRGHEERSRKGKPLPPPPLLLLSQKASSFHGRSPAAMEAAKPLPRPRTVPELPARKGLAAQASASAASAAGADEKPRLTKLLLNVTLQGSVGPVHVVTTPESTVGDLIAAALRQYLKEGRRPISPTADPSGFDLHYSQFSLESLDREEKLMALGSRNFFLCAKRPPPRDGVAAAGSGGSSPASCGKEAEKVSRNGFNWLKFMDFKL
ncbi:uncharacterized protein At4g22758 [Syzygium oleosum]|uniref:uncharacterized protein At4g22758 n=1 Tax=Syzygium oleosum TaxID=219896 RepID=UPI0011D20FE1|nr:uncharacterized protein At4g22758 [Syzygium oleosum]